MFCLYHIVLFNSLYVPVLCRSILTFGLISTSMETVSDRYSASSSPGHFSMEVLTVHWNQKNTTYVDVAVLYAKVERNSRSSLYSDDRSSYVNSNHQIMLFVYFPTGLKASRPQTGNERRLVALFSTVRRNRTISQTISKLRRLVMDWNIFLSTCHSCYKGLMCLEVAFKVQKNGHRVPLTSHCKGLSQKILLIKAEHKWRASWGRNRNI